MLEVLHQFDYFVPNKFTKPAIYYISISCIIKFDMYRVKYYCAVSSVDFMSSVKKC